MRKEETQQLVLLSIFTAIIALMTFTQIGYIILVPGVTITLIHVPVLIGVFVLKPKYSFALGFVFGFSSFIAAYTIASTPFDLAFRNPLISVLPRVLFVLAAIFINIGLKSLIKLKIGNYLIFGIVSLISITAIYFGSTAIVKSIVWNDYNNAVTENLTWESKHVLERPILPPYSEVEIANLNNQAAQNEAFVLSIVIPIALVVAAVFITLYYALVTKNDYESVVVPSSFIISTIAHTILVLAAVITFSNDFTMAFQDATALIYSIAMSNGLIEAIFAVFIGTPIYYALKKSKNLVK